MCIHTISTRGLSAPLSIQTQASWSPLKADVLEEVTALPEEGGLVKLPLNYCPLLSFHELTAYTPTVKPHTVKKKANT